MYVVLCPRTLAPVLKGPDLTGVADKSHGFMSQAAPCLDSCQAGKVARERLPHECPQLSLIKERDFNQNLGFETADIPLPKT